LPPVFVSVGCVARPQQYAVGFPHSARAEYSQLYTYQTVTQVAAAAYAMPSLESGGARFSGALARHTAQEDWAAMFPATSTPEYSFTQPKC